MGKTDAPDRKRPLPNQSPPSSPDQSPNQAQTPNLSNRQQPQTRQTPQTPISQSQQLLPPQIPPIPTPQTLNSPPPTPQQQARFLKADGSPAEYSTRVEDLHPESQKIVLQVQEHLQQYKDESEMLDRCARLHDTSSDYFDLEAKRISQELRWLSSITAREKTKVQNLMPAVRALRRKVDVAIKSFGSRQMHKDFNQVVQQRPTTFLQNTVHRFENELMEHCKWIDDHEQLIKMDTWGPSSSSSSSLQVLPNVMRNVHDFLVHVASKVDGLHDTVASSRDLFLWDRRRRGQEGDPFLEAVRRETARQEGATRRVRPKVAPSSAHFAPSSAYFDFSSLQPRVPALVIAFPSSSMTSTALAHSPTQFTSFGCPPQPTAFATFTASMFETPQTPVQTRPSNQFNPFTFSPQILNFTPGGTSQFGGPHPSTIAVGSSTGVAGFGASPSRPSTCHPSKSRSRSRSRSGHRR